jgi:hypothetical protein
MQHLWGVQLYLTKRFSLFYDSQLYIHIPCQRLVRFFAYLRIKPHAPLLVRVPVNFFGFQPCGYTTQAGGLSR